MLKKFSINDMPGIVYQAIMQSISAPFTIIDREFRLLWINIEKQENKYVGNICYEIF